MSTIGCEKPPVDGVGTDYATLALTPKIQVFRCTPAADWKREIPEEYLNAFETAATWVEGVTRKITAESDTMLRMK